MSTPSSIGIMEWNGTIRMIYCHSDGSPVFNGKILLNHFKTAESVRNLIALGDISRLAAKSRRPPKGHSFESPVKDYVVAYHRDRGDKHTKPHVTAMLYRYNRSVRNTFGNCEWHYLYDTVTSSWRVRQRGTTLQLLTHEIIEKDSL